MSHNFFKYGSNTSGLPSRTSMSLWDRITKKAHDVWSIGEHGGSPVITRLRGETVNSREEPVHAHPERNNGAQELNVGDVVLLFMGGKRVLAKISSLTEVDATIEHNGASITVLKNWLTKVE
jgi:hypothetical protein